MSLDSFFFAVRSAIKNMFRNAVLSLATVSVLTVCFVFFGSMTLVMLNVNAFVEELGGKNQIVIYLDENTTEDEIIAVGDTLRTVGNVSNVVYESPETALEKYCAEINDPALTEGLDASVFRPSYVFELIDLNKFEQTMYEIEKIEAIGTFSDGSPAIRSPYEVVTRLVSIREVLTVFSVCLVTVFLITAVFIIINAVRLSVYARREEIFIMTCVGATSFYVKLPYFIEGILTGLLGGVISYLLQLGVYNSVLVPILTELELFSPVVLESGLNALLYVFLASGAFVGAIGPLFSVDKYIEKNMK